LHAHDVVYRDIKPENILIDIDGHIKIADFGLSKIIPRRQRSHSFCGSPEYMCPEILLGQGHDRKADIYCLGALLYELVVGFPPHFNQDHNEIYKGIVNREPEYKEHNLSPSLEDLLRRLLQKDPMKRFQEMKDIKNHEWIRGVEWDRVLAMDYTPPIVPGPHECCIDEEFLNLPLDFEDSSVPVPTERR
jgi:serum/glucocorticoid-regulated kinase 2